eukprot:gene7451-7661_t
MSGTMNLPLLVLVLTLLRAPATAASITSRTLFQATVPKVAEQPAADTSGTALPHLSNTSAQGSADFSNPANATNQKLGNQSHEPLLARAERPLLAENPLNDSHEFDFSGSSSKVLCPAETARVSAAGCPCTMQQPINKRRASSSGQSLIKRRNTTEHVCPAGFRCSPSTASAMVAAGWQQAAKRTGSALNSSLLFASDATGPAVGRVPDQRGICVPCQLGEFCPQGTQEESKLSLAACQLQPVGSGPSSSPDSRMDQLGQATATDACKGFKPCPEGKFCPDASAALPCEAGRWCPGGSVASQSCNMASMLVWNPFRTIQHDPVVMLETLVNSNQALDGNTCPGNATTPMTACPAGYFCPTAARRMLCPIAYYCPGNSVGPKRCPALGDCNSPGLAKPDWSWLGLVTMLLLMTALMTVIEFIRVNNRKLTRAIMQDDDVVQLIGAVGFKIVQDQDELTVHRAGDEKANKQYHMGLFRSSSLKRLANVHQLLGGHWLSRTWTSITGWPQRLRKAQKQNVTTAKHSSINGMKTGLHAEVTEILHTKDHTQTRAGSDEENQVQSSQGYDSADEEEEGDADDALSTSTSEGGEYQINPRLTLVFRDVWVSDRSMNPSLPKKAFQSLQACCKLPGKQCDVSRGKQGSPWSIAEARLEAAATDGAKFIVPGVGGKFAHSQLHAIMGPSGCGKSTLCKALAGRLPMSRVSGDIRVVCSSAADGFQSQSELAMAGCQASCSLRLDIANMTGFVPQFDLLHETLTVTENLGNSACLRLPVSKKAAHSQRARMKEVFHVVGEVMSLMALNKVANQVVGCSGARLLSGGQRKRAAIGVELVAKPSLLWLDEPTSGLDAAVAYDVVEALKNSSERGMNVLAVMHQPRCSIFNMFDTCLLLSSNGYVVYAGPQHLAAPFMSFLGFRPPPGENEADFLMDVISGVVPRPGDPNYVPTQLARMWDRAGDLWVQQQLRRAQRTQQPGEAMSRQNSGASGLLLMAPISAAPVDWPWRPRDLEALLTRFKLLTDRKSAPGDAATSPELTYEGFLSFWDEAGVKQLLGEVQFADFIQGVCDDFGMAPGRTITQGQFLDVLKAQLRAAAGVAAFQDEEPAGTAGAAATLASAPEQRSDKQQAVVEDIPAAAAVAATPSPLGTSSSSPFFAAGQLALEVAQSIPTHSDAGGTGTPQSSTPAQTSLCHLSSHQLAEELEAAAVKACAAAEASSGETQARHCSMAAALAAAAAESSCLAATGQHQPVPAESLCSLTPSELLAASEGLPEACKASARQVCPQGMLTCSAMRMQQRALLRQGSKGVRCPKATPPGSFSQGAPPGSCSSGQSTPRRFPQAPSGVARELSGLCEDPAGSSHPQSKQQVLRALAKCRKLRKAQAAGPLGGGQDQLSQVQSLRCPEPRSFAAACTSVEDARESSHKSGVQERGGLAPVREDDAEQQDQLPDLQAAGPAIKPDAPLDAPRLQQLASMKLQREAPDANAAGAGLTAATASGDVHPRSSGVSSAPLAAARQVTGAGPNGHAIGAAIAAVTSRKLPSAYNQLRTIIFRCSRKLVACRSSLMTDLLLTSVLGIALGVAQGRDQDPAQAQLWLLITLLAYGTLMLARSTHTFGRERHIYLQLECHGGVAASAWVFGHQIHDFIGLLLHPAVFFAWLYVLTLTTVPAWSYYLVLLLIGGYTTGLGYLVSLAVSPANVTTAGLAVALLLGGVANGIAPRLWTLSAYNPILWLDAFSYTRWGLRILYISWLTPTPAAKAPATAAFLSGLGFCGLQHDTMVALQSSGVSASSSGGGQMNSTGPSAPDAATIRSWWGLNSAQRSDALVASAAAAAGNATAQNAGQANAALALTQLWQFYHRPEMLRDHCHSKSVDAALVLMGLSLGCRLLVFLLVKWKVRNKAYE